MNLYESTALAPPQERQGRLRAGHQVQRGSKGVTPFRSPAWASPRIGRRAGYLVSEDNPIVRGLYARLSGLRQFIPARLRG
jgi:hypothetical protein